MQTVNIKREELLKKVEENREKHKAIADEAMEGYREEAIKELTAALKVAKSGGPIKRHLSLVEPIDKTNDYDEVIAMLKMSSDDVIELQSYEFNQYVLDKWNWKAQFELSNSTYSKAAMAR